MKTKSHITIETGTKELELRSNSQSPLVSLCVVDEDGAHAVAIPHDVLLEALESCVVLDDSEPPEDGGDAADDDDEDAAPVRSLRPVAGEGGQ